MRGKTMRGKTMRGKTMRGKTMRGKTMRGKTMRGKTMRGKTMRGKTMRGRRGQWQLAFLHDTYCIVVKYGDKEYTVWAMAIGLIAGYISYPCIHHKKAKKRKNKKNIPILNKKSQNTNIFIF
ncbi:hypothetical protein [Myroides odoratus]|nr:hypothetical protein [Myroides odoratus]